MTISPLSSPDSPLPSRRAPFFPLLLWLLIQLLALALALAHVRFWPDPPRPLDHLALAELLVVQCSALALLFPLLLRTPLTAALVLLSSWPFCQFAAFVSATPAPRWVAAAAALSLWLIGLALWRVALRSRWLQQLGITLAAALTLGGPVLVYLGAEFGSQPAPTVPGPTAAAVGPILSCLAPLQSASPPRTGWVFLAIHVGIAAAAALLARRGHSAAETQPN
jgi:hypothetical protein